MERHKGNVKFFDAAKGWGFIVSSACPKDVFVHYRSIKGDGYKVLTEDQEVTFELHEKQIGKYEAREVEPKV